LLLLEEGYVKMYLKGRPITMYMAKDLVETYCLEAKSDLPNKKLKLDWVYPFSVQWGHFQIWKANRKCIFQKIRN
jgi:hypothetical protein